MSRFCLKRVEAFVLRVPLDVPVKTSFGSMYDRPAVLVRVEDADGLTGWGEIWCNWPACGAEHRARLLITDLADLVLNRAFEHPAELYRDLTERLAVKALQTGEPGPYSQTIAGLDIAVWDLAGKREEVPTFALLSVDAGRSIRAYASGIHINDAEHIIPQCRTAGFRDFKVKVGFDKNRDSALVRALAQSLEPGERLYADANQGWTLENALIFLSLIGRADVGWMEEPLRVDAPRENWRKLASSTDIPLAGGENLIGFDAFCDIIDNRVLDVVQPDVAKWGGISGCIEVARLALDAGRRYCPHFLGAGIGLVASAHLLAAAGGDGLLEIDVNPNPLRAAVVPAWPYVREGRVELLDRPGLGVEPDFSQINTYRTSHFEQAC